jgi:CRISPR/Cas system CMR-associated protein Cmr1 (group 7 of RAMP superfamily)
MTDIFTVLVFWWVVTLHGAVGRYSRFREHTTIFFGLNTRGSSIYLQVNTAF